MRLVIVVLLALVTTGWAVWLAAAPALVASGGTGPALWAAALTYRAGAVVCHQRDARSFHVAGVRMPVCSRCTGLYAGAALGVLAAVGWIAARRRAAVRLRLPPIERLRWGMVGAAVPTALAWAAERLAGMAVPGGARALAAVPLGAAVGALVALWAGGAPVGDTGTGSALH